MSGATTDQEEEITDRSEKMTKYSRGEFSLRNTGVEALNHHYASETAISLMRCTQDDAAEFIIELSNLNRLSFQISKLREGDHHVADIFSKSDDGPRRRVFQGPPPLAGVTSDAMPAGIRSFIIHVSTHLL